MADINSLKQYLRDADDDTLRLYLESAKAYAINAGVPEPEEPKPLYDLLVYMMAANWYDNRGVQAIGTEVTDLSLSVNSLILQLRNEVPDNDT